MLDAWKGARRWALSDDNLSKFSVTRQEYEEKGGDYLKEHMCSNNYINLPIPIKKGLTSTATVPTRQEQMDM